MSDDSFTAAAEPVVIVGMAVEAPGGIDTAEGYWELLSHGREALGPFPTDRGWRIRELLAGSRRSGFKEIHDCGGFLTGATTFTEFCLESCIISVASIEMSFTACSNRCVRQ